MALVLLAPGEVENARHRLSVAEQRRLAPAHLPLLDRVDLVELRVTRACPADPDRDREGVVRNGEHALGRAGALRREHEPEQVGAGLGRDGDVLVACQAADLDERAGEELGELRRRVGGAHERRADEDRIRSRELRGRPVGPGCDAGLRDDNAVAGGAGDQLELPATIDGEGREVTGIHADNGCVQHDRPAELLRVVSLDKRVETEARRFPP